MGNRSNTSKIDAAIIQTAKLPRICPACGANPATLIAHLSLPRIWDLRCVCGYVQRYQVTS